MNWSTIALTSVGVLYILFGLYVLIKRRFDRIGWIFIALTLGIAAWNLSLALIEGEIVTGKWGIIILDRLSYIAVPVIGNSIVLYLLALLDGSWWQNLKRNKVLISLAALALAIVILTPTNLISSNPGQKGMSTGPLMPIVGAYVLIVSAYIVYLCIIGWKFGPEESRKRFWFVLLGYILAATCSLVTNVVLPIMGYPAYSAFGPLSTIFIVWFIGLGAVGATIAGTILGVISSIIATILISLIVIGAAIALIAIVFSASIAKLT